MNFETGSDEVRIYVKVILATTRGAVVAQLAKWLLPTTKDPGSNLTISIFSIHLLLTR